MLRVLLCLLLLAAPVAAQDLPALFRVTGVAPNDVLNIREEPSARSAIIGALAPSTRGVEVVARDAGGGWGRVNTGERAGWVAMRFLAAEGDPGWNTLAPRLSCFGTEPFWSADWVPEARTLWVVRMGEASSRHVLAWNGGLEGRPPIGAGLAFTDGGFATIRRGLCSDGMSDRVYGLSIFLFATPGDGLEGCCTLAVAR